ncbi:MAG: cupin domain-containing protein [Actinomycetota bacterium]|nr:cupin domain-containing protein [Actinomycetota bacterium]
MTTPFEVLTEQRRNELRLPGGSLMTIMLEQVTKVAVDEPLVTMLTIELEPGSAGSPRHLHPGPVFGYVLEGELLFQCQGTQKAIYQEGDVFWEPGIDLPHLLAANPNPDRRTRFLAICVGVPGQPVTQFIQPLSNDAG